MIAVAVAVTAAGALRAIKNEGQVLETLLLIDAFQLGKHGAVEQSGTDDEESAVGYLFQYLCVRYNVDRRAVDEHVVVFTA